MLVAVLGFQSSKSVDPSPSTVGYALLLLRDFVV
jgi:hypothetical protein